jgi:hypothetical protein
MPAGSSLDALFQLHPLENRLPAPFAGPGQWPGGLPGADATALPFALAEEGDGPAGPWLDTLAAASAAAAVGLKAWYVVSRRRRRAGGVDPGDFLS